MFNAITGEILENTESALARKMVRGTGRGRGRAGGSAFFRSDSSGRSAFVLVLNATTVGAFDVLLAVPGFTAYQQEGETHRFR